jgi:hypothetical protein
MSKYSMIVSVFLRGVALPFALVVWVGIVARASIADTHATDKRDSPSGFAAACN